ncbi:hypothetical protein BS50DRAFT_493640 [Corynespora cassiicola Philippines]|uniref:Mediator of RNA polymerase II transcription subunit 17 n=1 Tax=Corynespora cassiicola Philippines TaxID=1448308 RepID=A0A2T2NPC4_CORCC|nr:hypothetical protein BS50DRAFT_493640 [Corynespora cassiicola Philippines]
MSAAGSTTNVALRPWPASKKDELTKDELLAQIGQLTVERGHLRDITEKTLQGEVDAGKHVPEESLEGVEQADKKDAAATKDRLEEIQRVRHEMWAKLQWAQFNAANALDLIALILSRDPSKNVDNAYSVMFKSQGVPNGSMGLDVSQPRESNSLEDQRRDTDNARRKQLVMRGSRMEALEWATDDLLKAATHLENEVRKETKYWEEILSISEKGWSIKKHRRDVRQSPFVVHYGLSEAGAHLKARGYAPLRMDKDGSIMLDPALALKPKTLRVRISDGGEITGTSTLPIGEATDLAIEKAIQLARDSVFEEELYHEMMIESRQLLAYGVHVRDSDIHVTVPGLGNKTLHRVVIIDCVARDEAMSQAQQHSQDGLAQNIADALRLLLAHEHRMRLHRRSQVPPPLTQQKRQAPQPPLLRTLLVMFNHLNAVDSLHSYLGNVVRTLNNAGLHVSLHASRESSWEKLAMKIQESTKTDLSAVDQLLEIFTRPYDGEARLSLPSNSMEAENIKIATRTFIGPPTFGAEHKLTLPPSLVAVLDLAQDQKREFKFSSSEDLSSYLDWILSLDIAHALLSREYAGSSTPAGREPRVTIASAAKKGERKKTDIDILLEKGQLKASAYGKETCIWTATSDQPSLRDKVKSWVG